MTLNQRQQVGGVQQEDDRADHWGTPHMMRAGVDAVDPVRMCWRQPTRYRTTGTTTALLHACRTKSEVVDHFEGSRQIQQNQCRHIAGIDG